MTKHDESRITEAFPLPFKLGTICPEKLEDLMLNSARWPQRKGWNKRHVRLRFAASKQDLSRILCGLLHVAQQVSLT